MLIVPLDPITGILGFFCAHDLDTVVVAKDAWNPAFSFVVMSNRL